MRNFARTSPCPLEMRPKSNDPLRELTKPPAGVRKPKTCGIASTKIMTMTRNFCVPWYTLLSSSSWRFRLMIFAPANSCMMIEAVTIGPIPRCIREPCAPARIARRLEKKSITFVRSRP